MLEREKQIFHPISLEDREWMSQKFLEENRSACEYVFANNLIWAQVYDVQVGEVCGCGVVRYRDHGDFEYSFPFGSGDQKAAIEVLRGICAAHGHRLSLNPIEEKDKDKLIWWFPGIFEIEMDRDAFDYVYTVEKLSALKGRKLHGKRNHIARFQDDGDWRYESMAEENIDECRKMAKEWIALRAEKWNEEMEQEMRVLEVAFSHFKELDLIGGVLYKQERIVAFTIGEQLNSDTLVVHFEKAYPNMQGAYPMINQQFVLHEAQNYAYVNREDDAGDAGLRKAKLSYYPDVLLKKYCARESHVVFANETDREAIIDIWQQCFGDDRNYIELYLDNRFEDENMLVIHENGHPVSMASLLPVQVTIDGEKRNARYVYAVATLPEYRKKGYASEIIRYAFEKYDEPLLLQPADEKLRDYYRRLGFVESFQKIPSQIYDCNDVEPGNCWNVSDADAARYKIIRDRHFSSEGYVEWDEKALAYAIRENEFCDGRTLILTEKEATGEQKREEIIMYRVEEEELRVIETTFDENELLEILPILFTDTHTTKTVTGNDGGMILLPEEWKAWNCSDGYLGLTLA